MNWLALKVNFQCYFGSNYAYVCVIAIIITCLVLFLKYKTLKIDNKNISKWELCLMTSLIMYLTLLLNVVIFSRNVGEYRQVNLIPFWSYQKVFVDKEISILKQMILNVVAFVPWAILFPLVFPKMNRFWVNVGSALVFSVLIECIQCVFRLGIAEFDDIFHNTLGALIGFGIMYLCEKYKKKGVMK